MPPRTKPKRTKPKLAGDGSQGSVLSDRRTIALALFGLAVALLFWMLWKKAAPVAKAPEEPEPTTEAPYYAAQPPPAPATAPSASASAAPADPPPVIDEIVLEKKEVCAGEENLVTVKSHTVNGTDAFLHTVIDGHMGSSFPVTLWTDSSGRLQGAHTVQVFGRGNVQTSVPLPTYTVKDCRVPFLVAITQRVRSNTTADFDFEAKLVAPRPPPMTDRQVRELNEADASLPEPPKPFKPVSFSWNFGDGETASAPVPTIEHNYEGRKQDTLYSYFLVEVTVRGAHGETATGRTTLPLMNSTFEALAMKGIVELQISLDPRFPSFGSDGVVRQNVKIWHTRPGPVTITQATVTSYYRNALGETPPSNVDAASVLHTTTIPPGKDGITTTVTLDPESEPEVFSKTWVLQGKSAEGYPAAGSFSVMLPPHNPTRDASVPVLDPLLKKKIMLARQLLGKPFVNDEDLWALERQGAFADLTVSPAETAAAQAAQAAANQAANAEATANAPPGKGASQSPAPGPRPAATGPAGVRGGPPAPPSPNR